MNDDLHQNRFYTKGTLTRMRTSLVNMLRDRESFYTNEECKNMADLLLIVDEILTDYDSNTRMMRVLIGHI